MCQAEVIPEREGGKNPKTRLNKEKKNPKLKKNQKDLRNRFCLLFHSEFSISSQFQEAGNYNQIAFQNIVPFPNYYIDFLLSSFYILGPISRALSSDISCNV